MPTTTFEAPGDALRRMLDDTIRAWDPLWQAWAAALPTWPAEERGQQPHRVRERGGCDHDHHQECGHDNHSHQHQHRPCHRAACDCCVGPADLVVVTRLGETRIVPLVLSNEWRRERAVEIEIGDFTPSCHEDALVRVSATTRPAGPITLAPCGRVEVGILLRTAPAARADEQVQAAEHPKETAAALATEEVATGRAGATELLERGIVDREGVLADAGCCTTMYADVRVSGCGGPLRLAVVVLPLRCDAYEVHCHCGCC
jgi:hypothetical protein